jgi:hypothetical protein
VFRPILESSRHPLTVPWALHSGGVDGTRVGSWRGCFVKSLLGGDAFPSWSDEVDEVASPLNVPMMHSHLSRGQGLLVRSHLVSSW